MRFIIPVLVVACVAAGSFAKPLDPRSILKTYFETGDIPTESQFSNLIDSVINLSNDGVEIYDWANVPIQSSNLAHDVANSDSMSSMSAVILGMGGGLAPGGEALRTLSIQFSATSSEGLWIADDIATFTSTGSFTFEVTNILRWELSAPVSMSLNGNPGEGTRMITGGTYLETTLLPTPGSAVLVLAGLVAVRRRR